MKIRNLLLPLVMVSLLSSSLIKADNTNSIVIDQVAGSDDLVLAIETIDILKRGTRQAEGTNEFTGTKLGFDKETQYNSIIDTGMGQIWFYREVNGVISARVPIGSNTTLESTNEDKKTVITVGDGQSVIIIINQSG